MQKKCKGCGCWFNAVPPSVDYCDDCMDDLVNDQNWVDELWMDDNED